MEFSKTTYILFVVGLIGLMGLGVYYQRQEKAPQATPATPETDSTVRDPLLTPVNLPATPQGAVYLLTDERGDELLSFTMGTEGATLLASVAQAPHPQEPLTLSIATEEMSTPLLQGTLQGGLRPLVNLTDLHVGAQLGLPDGLNAPSEYAGIWFADLATESSLLELPVLPQGYVYEASLFVNEISIPFARFSDPMTDELTVFFTGTTTLPGEAFVTVDTNEWPALAAIAQAQNLRTDTPLITLSLHVNNTIAFPLAQTQLNKDIGTRTTIPFELITQPPQLQIIW